MTATLDFEISPDAIARLGDTLDHIMTIDIAGRRAIGPLYRDQRERRGQPLSTLAAKRLLGALTPGAVALIFTGFPVRPWISSAIGETDGPPGAAALAWGLAVGCGAIPIVATAAAMVGQAEAALGAMGLMVLTLDEARRSARGPRPSAAAVVQAFTREKAEAAAHAQALLDMLAPAVVIAVEHPGPNRRGVKHNATGHDVTAASPASEAVFDLASRRGILTLSFADMPNEIGCGLVAEVARQHVAFAARCSCPCGEGIASTTLVDELVLATTANWAAYATVVALAALAGKPTASITAAKDEHAIAATIAAGAVEGVSGSTDPAAGVDGVPTAVSALVVELMRAAAESYAEGKGRTAF